jgi:hypothetical protein
VTFAERRLAVANTFDSLIELTDDFFSKTQLPKIHTWHWQPLLADNDRTRRFVGEQLNILQIRLQAALFEVENDVSWSELMYDNEDILAAAYLIKLLTERFDIRPIEILTIQQWKKKYLAWFDSEYDEKGKQSEYYLKRIEVIKDTFDDLIYLSKNWIPYHQRKPKSL